MNGINWKGTLLELAQKTNFMMKFGYFRQGPPHNEQFQATVSGPDGTVYTGEWCGSKRAAEHSACRVCIDKIKEVGPVEKNIQQDYVRFDENRNYKNELQIMCQKYRVIFPIYSFEKHGHDHKPEYTATCTLGEYVYNSDVKFSLKKKSEFYAAWLALKSHRFGTASSEPPLKIKKAGDNRFDMEEIAYTPAPICKWSIDDGMELPESGIQFGVATTIPITSTLYFDSLEKNVEVTPKMPTSTGLAVGNFEKKINYTKRVGMYSRWYGKCLPTYNVLKTYIGRRTLYDAVLHIGKQVFQSDTPQDGPDEAINYVSWQFMSQVSLVDYERAVASCRLTMQVVADSIVLHEKKSDGSCNKSLSKLLWYEIASWLPSMFSVNKLLFVCRAFFHYFNDDAFWLSIVHQRTVDCYRSWVRQLSGMPFPIYSSKMSLRTMINRQQIYRFFIDKLESFCDVTKKPSCHVTISAVHRCCEKNFVCKEFYVDREIRGLVLDIEYVRDFSMRFEAERERAVDKVWNKGADYSHSYVISRELIPGRYYSIMADIPNEQEFDAMLQPLVSASGGGVELQFLNDPYVNSYMSLIIIYFHQLHLLLEIGCESNMF